MNRITFKDGTFRLNGKYIESGRAWELAKKLYAHKHYQLQAELAKAEAGKIINEKV